eukprot:CAMPEP_0180207860 /NCGR_PEP_ID=MMETSP0987-20121128/10409_1 /TAXON_ID=697907 /ORGANISM="non described non described, Strain CCMP2293" /LENGTH=90 /DNA_ID=CAMNT_0022163923 /DNA_START=107 /DNA_END=379 /DNA_ORIENTATION=-
MSRPTWGSLGDRPETGPNGAERMFTSLWELEELKAKTAKKAVVDPNYVPTFEAAIANPEQAMSQVLAMKVNKSPAIRTYDLKSSKRTKPW